MSVSHAGAPLLLFPSFVQVESRAVASFSREATPDEAAAYARELAGMPSGRRTEFLAGRRCARAALRACAPELGAPAVPIGTEREPRWPEGIVGSITHTPTWAAAAVARASHARALGFDIEEIMGATTAGEVRDLVASGAEVALVEKALALDGPAAVTLIFSAKEAVFKCLFPIVRRYFGHQEARMVRVDGAGASCILQVVTDLGAGVWAGTELEVRFGIDARHIHTGTWLRPEPPR